MPHDDLSDRYEPETAGDRAILALAVPVEDDADRPEPSEAERDQVRAWWRRTDTTADHAATVARWQRDVEILEGEEDAPEEDGEDPEQGDTRASTVYERTLRNRDMLVALLAPDEHHVGWQPEDDADPTPADPDAGAPDPELSSFADTLTKVMRKRTAKARIHQMVRAWVHEVCSFRWGVLKADYYTDIEIDPLTDAEPDDLEEQIGLLRVLVADFRRGEFSEDSERFREMVQLLEAIQGNTDIVDRSGFGFDVVSVPSFAISPEVRRIENYQRAEWMREDFWWSRDRVLRTFPGVDPQDLARARIYDQHHQPIATPGEEWHRDQVTQLKDRDEADDILRVREIWSRRLRRRMVLVDGLDYFAYEECPKRRPDRFYPYYIVALNRSTVRPQGLSQTEIQEHIETEQRKTRRKEDLAKEAAIPRGVYDTGQMEHADPVKLSNIAAFTFEGVDMGGREGKDMFFPLPTAGAINPQIYDTSKREQDQDNAAMIPRQLRGETGVADFAAEVHAATSGTNTLLRAVRTLFHEALADLYTALAQQLLQEEGPAEVVRDVGEDAVWPDAPPDRLTLFEGLRVVVDVDLDKDQVNQQEMAQTTAFLEALAKFQVQWNPFGLAELVGEVFGKEHLLGKLLHVDVQTHVQALMSNPQALTGASPEALAALLQLGSQAQALLQTMQQAATMNPGAAGGGAQPQSQGAP